MIKEARTAAGLTQKQAAALLGVPLRSLQDWEDGRRMPKKGAEYYAEVLKALGHLTKDGQESVLEGDTTLEDVLRIGKLEDARKLSKWGAYGNTFSTCFDMIPDGVFDRVTAEQLAGLIDAIQQAYNNGVAHGSGAE